MHSFDTPFWCLLDSEDALILLDSAKYMQRKENVGEYWNGGAEYSEKGNPVKVLDHDFMDKEKGKGKLAPYGVYDIANNEGYVNVGISFDAAQFAVNSIRMWWHEMGA